MIPARELLACPACGGALASEWRCSQCAAEFTAPGGIPNLRLDSGSRSETVRQFYEAAPFPGYPPGDTLGAFRARAERSAFAQSLDRAIAGDARIADIGCGTGQMSLYLARADRVIVGADLSRAALRLGQEAATRFGIDRVQFVETDLHHPGLKPGAFDVVYSSGVLHHTPNPREAFRRIAPLARPGGIVVIGVYNTFARMPLRLRRVFARATGLRVVPFDPILRERQRHAARRLAWVRDQYAHPEEHSHTVAETKRWLRENGVDYLRSFPSTVFGDDPDDLFAPAVDDWSVEAWIAQIGWIRTLGREGGLFMTIGRRTPAAEC
ncbi:MAG TPA: class I SAM-dependent methyltransferase [Vicinamibacterales bacterium]|nr:class I SAM-dependent methyltransferase [Vicinamibacterales bacterium]